MSSTQHFYVAHYGIMAQVGEDEPSTRVDEVATPQLTSISTRWSEDWVNQLKAQVEADIVYALGEDAPHETVWIDTGWVKPARKGARDHMVMQVFDDANDHHTDEDVLGAIVFQIMHDGEVGSAGDDDPAL